MYRQTSNVPFSRSSSPTPAAQPHATSSTVVNNAHAAPKAPRPELRADTIEPHWEPVIDLATD